MISNSKNSILSLAESLASRFERTQADFIRDMYLKVRLILLNGDHAKKKEIVEFMEECLNLGDVKLPMPITPFKEALGIFWKSKRELRKLNRRESDKNSRLFTESRAEVAVQQVMDQAAIAINKDREADAVRAGISLVPYALEDDLKSLDESLPPSPTS